MNHADETRDLLQPLQALAGKDAAFDLELAVALATLELAEQQRIANLIALSGPLAEILDDPATSRDGVRIHPDIAAALKDGNQR